MREDEMLVSSEIEAEELESEELESLDELEEELSGEELLEDDGIESVDASTDEGKLLYIPKSCLDAGQIIKIIRRMLRDMNPKYIDLAERTAYCSIKLFDYAKLNGKLNADIDSILQQLSDLHQKAQKGEL